MNARIGIGLLLLAGGCGPKVGSGDQPDLVAVGAPDAAVADLTYADLVAAVDATPIVDAAMDLRPDGGLGTLKGTVQLTYYWIVFEKDYPGLADTDLCDGQANPIARVPLAFAKAIRLEGTGRLLDGRLLNASSNCNCPSGMTTCYAVLDPIKYPWGAGAVGALKPFRSIAVDRNFIPLRSKVYVPEFDGLQMPSTYGFLHDGCLSADDVGGGIQGAQIDFFAAEKANYLTLDQVLGASVTAYVNPTRCP